MLLRLSTLCAGFSGVRPEVVRAYAGLLNAHLTPVVLEYGSLGCSGDLAPLAHCALALLGEGEVTDVGGDRVPAAEALASAGLTPLELDEKEGLALINGTDGMLGMLVLAITDLHGLVRVADIASAMSIEALLGTDCVMAAELQALRPHPGQAASARNMARLLHGSSIMASHRTGDRRVQDAYSLRCAPQVIGAARDAIGYARKIVTEEINAATDNPLIFLDLEGENKARSGGNFHGESVALALNLLALAVAEIGSISERRVFRLTSAHLSDGLPMMLVEGGGTNSGLMMAQVTAASLVSESKTLAHPASVDSIPTSADQEDHVSMSTNAARHAREIVWNTTRILAIELIAAAQGIDLRLKNLGCGVETLGRGTRIAHTRIRCAISFLERDRVLSKDIERAVELIVSGKLLKGLD
jgi:histidine ammonia-lyase